MKTFLTAEWRNLINLTYEVSPEVLASFLPPGLELDLLNGHAHVSLVAFDFLQTRVKGFKVPFHTDFPEINLRYYVQYKGKRGVCFIREFVPKHCIALIANRVYNEPYMAFPMESKVEKEEDGRLQIHHQLWKGKDELDLRVTATAERTLPGPETAAHFFKEHDLGFGVDKKGETLAYFVEHPLWETREIESLELKIDFGKIYGEEWAFLNDQQPAYKLFADGSAIKVYSSMRLQEVDQKLAEGQG